VPEKTAERLLAAAGDLIVERGWTAVTTRVLADRAGVRPGVVHYHFASVPALLREASVATIRALLAQALPALAEAGTPREVLAVLAGFLARHDGRDPASLLVTETYLAATRDETLRHDLGRIVADFRAALTGRLDALGVPAPAATAAVLAASVDGILLHRALLPESDPAAVLPVLERLFGSAPGFSAAGALTKEDR
jgi:AcrR family transcriptional regulator